MPPWASGPGFRSVTSTDEELSVVCPEDDVPNGVRAERGWSLIRLHGPFAFSEVGILAAIAAPLARAGVPIFALSTFDTDYVLVPGPNEAAALRALEEAGHVLSPDPPRRST